MLYKLNFTFNKGNQFEEVIFNSCCVGFEAFIFFRLILYLFGESEYATHDGRINLILFSELNTKIKKNKLVDIFLIFL